MNEYGYIRSVHRQLPSSLYRWKINDDYEGGVADAFYAGKNRILFVEYKYLPKVPVKPSTVIKPKLSALQVHWLNARHAQNVPVVAILGTPEGGICFVNGSWEHGAAKAEVMPYALRPADVASIIVTHCEGKTHVTHNAQIYHNYGRSTKSPAPQSTLALA